MTIVEAFACGTPVLCSALGGMQELVSNQRTGLHFAPSDAADLARKATWAIGHPSEMYSMGRECRREYEARYTPEKKLSATDEDLRKHYGIVCLKSHILQ